MNAILTFITIFLATRARPVTLIKRSTSRSEYKQNKRIDSGAPVAPPSLGRRALSAAAICTQLEDGDEEDRGEQGRAPHAAALVREIAAAATRGCYPGVFRNESLRALLGCRRRRRVAPTLITSATLCALDRRSEAMYGSAHGEWESKGLLAVQPG